MTWVKAGVGAVLQAARRLLEPVTLRLSERRVVHGVLLVDLTPDQTAAEGMRKTEKALDTLSRYDPRRLARMRSDVRYVALTHAGENAGEYWPDLRAIHLDAAVTRRQSAEAVAMTLVHEATHARLWKRGVGKHPDRERIERICASAEVAFARRVPGTEHLVEGVGLKLASRYWERLDAPVGERLEQLGYPRWAQRMMDWMRSRES